MFTLRRNKLFFSRFLASQQQDPSAVWVVPDERVCEANVRVGPGAGGELVVGGVHLKLFLANPGWALRRPKEFLIELLDSCQALMARDPTNVRLS